MKSKIAVVCMANYCRSPVAELFLKKRFQENFNVSSYGIIQFDKYGMDPRSLNYLKKKNLQILDIHQPKKISKKVFEESEVIFAMDIKVLMHLNNQFKDSQKKLRLFSLPNETTIIKDPYKIDNKKEYDKVMEKIEFVSNNIKI